MSLLPKNHRQLPLLFISGYFTTVPVCYYYSAGSAIWKRLRTTHFPIKYSKFYLLSRSFSLFIIILTRRFTDKNSFVCVCLPPIQSLSTSAASTTVHITVFIHFLQNSSHCNFFLFAFASKPAKVPELFILREQLPTRKNHSTGSLLKMHK